MVNPLGTGHVLSWMLTGLKAFEIWISLSHKKFGYFAYSRKFCDPGCGMKTWITPTQIGDAWKILKMKPFLNSMWKCDSVNETRWLNSDETRRENGCIAGWTGSTPSMTVWRFYSFWRRMPNSSIHIKQRTLLENIFGNINLERDCFYCVYTLFSLLYLFSIAYSIV